MTDRKHNLGADKLRSFVERIERAEQERKAAAEAVSDLYKEAKSSGYHVKALRALIRERAADPGKVAEYREQLDLFREALS